MDLRTLGKRLVTTFLRYVQERQAAHGSGRVYRDAFMLAAFLLHLFQHRRFRWPLRLRRQRASLLQRFAAASVFVAVLRMSMNRRAAEET
jgi:hypothetical protein